MSCSYNFLNIGHFCDAAESATIMFDAEQTYLQPAIDHVVLRLAEKYNKTRPVVYNTYQAYLTDCEYVK